jgi:uncharacterized cupredoxin-like copper-binding protein
MEPKIAMSLKALSLALAMCGASLWVQAAGTHTHPDTPIGAPGHSDKVTRTITIDMQDNMRFVPATLAVKQGETIRLLVRNKGAMTHELVMGNSQDLLAHAKAMQQAPQMQHRDPNSLSLAPGTQGELLWHFTRAMTVDFACLQPGHFESGMRGKIEVAKGHSDAHAH